MQTFLFQDWVSVQGAVGMTQFVQAPELYLDLEAFQDVWFHLDVRQAANAQMLYETAPIRDDRFFRPMTSGGFAMAASMTPDVRSYVLASNPTVPLARWIRWRITQDPAAVSNATFRIHVVANTLAV